MYNLIITEKPSVARTISKVLGVTTLRDGYLEGSGWLVSWCVGHLVELAPPGAYDPRLERWERADLPILPERWQYLVSSSTKRQFDVLCKLMHRADVDRIVCATDAGREGEEEIVLLEKSDTEADEDAEHKAYQTSNGTRRKT